MNTFYYRHNKYTQRPQPIPCDTIPFNELTIAIKGQLKYEVDGESYTVNGGDCLFIKSGQTRMRKKSEQCDYVSFNFYDNVYIDLPVHISDCVTSEIKLILSVCDQIYLKYNNWFNKVDKALELIFNLLKDKISSLEENPVIISIKRYIRKNLSCKLTLNAIAKQVGYTPNYCDALFKKETGISIINYLIMERIAEAKRLLDEKILSLKDIADSVGFEDYNYFSRTFKKLSGISPTEYRALNAH